MELILFHLFVNGAVRSPDREGTRAAFLAVVLWGIRIDIGRERRSGEEISGRLVKRR